MIHRPPTRRLMLAGCLTALLGAVLPAGRVEAVSPYLNAFNDEFGTSRTRLDTCGLCHGNFNNNSNGRNLFGSAFETIPTHGSDPVGALRALLTSDSDQDGTPSGDEIRILFMPGWSCNDFATATNAPSDLADYVDPAPPGCTLEPEISCFDGLDNDFDGAADCADSDCEGSFGDTCATGQPGICSSGVLTCSSGSEVCTAELMPVLEGPAGNATCSDGLDNDCDTTVDLIDPGCQPTREGNCEDGVDNDADGLADCVDPDCAGAVLGDCNSGELGICALGTLSCVDGQQLCAPTPAEIEGPAGTATCTDADDNDCDGFADGADADCQSDQAADVYQLDLRAPSQLKLRGDRVASRNIVVTAEGDVRAQQATVTLAAAPLESVTVAIDPASMSRTIEPGGGKTRFAFRASFRCNAVGTWMVEWTARIEASENREAIDDLLSGSTLVVCR